MPIMKTFPEHGISWHYCLQSCVIPNFGSNSANIKNCFIVANSLSDTLTKNVIQLQGMAFPNEICLLIANNAVKSVAVSVQMFQYYDCKSPPLCNCIQLLIRRYNECMKLLSHLLYYMMGAS